MKTIYQIEIEAGIACVQGWLEDAELVGLSKEAAVSKAVKLMSSTMDSYQILEALKRANAYDLWK